MNITDQELEKELEDIDSFLRQEKIAIPGRPIRAVTEFSKKHVIGLPLTEPSPDHELYQYWSITKFIIKWFDDRYGNRLGMDIGPGKCAFLLKDDPWFFHYPKFYGEYQFEASLEDSLGSDQIYNILDAINDFPQGLKKSLNDLELKELLNIFCLGLSSLSILNKQITNELIKSATADINAAVTHIMSQKSEYGLSKWSSLQATEKVLKSTILNYGQKFKKTHDLEVLAQQLNSLGIKIDIEAEINQIKCLPSIRYGEELVTLETAIKAHHASLKVVQLSQTHNK